jgi:hypothetical protein
MGYGKTRPKLAAGNDAIELQQPRSSRVDADEAPLRSARK